MNPLHDDLRRPHTFEPLDVEGVLPVGVAGTLYRAGPGVFERFGSRVRHAFEADGVISAVRLDGRGGALGAAAIVESDGYREEEAAGKRLYGSDAGWLRRIRNMAGFRDKATGNTNVLHWQGRLLALMEGAPPAELDPGDLSPMPDTDLGVIRQAFSAHPHRVAARRCTYGFGMRYGRRTLLDLYALPDQGAARWLGDVELPWPGLVHDCAVTERHIVFVIAPLVLNTLAALLGRDVSRMFSWEPARGCVVLVVPLDAPEAVRRIDVEAFWTWHVANAYERGDDVVVDLVTYPDASSLKAIGTDDTAAPPRLDRLVLGAHSASRTALTELTCEFPMVHPAWWGRTPRSCWVYTERDGAGGIARVDLTTGRHQTWWTPPGGSASEPVVVPRSDDDDDAWVLSLVYDPARERSGVAVLDGQRIEDGPVARVWFAQPIPLTFHGTWVGDR